MRKMITGVIVFILGGLLGIAAEVVDTKDLIKGIDVQSTGKKFVVATVVKVDGIAWFDRMRVGVDQFKKNTGHDAWMVGPSQADAAAQIQLIEGLIAQGIDAIVVVPFSTEALEPVLRKARSKGIVVVVHEGSTAKNADYILEAFDNFAYGAQLMKVLAEKMGGKGQYIGTVGSLTSTSQNQWIDGGVAYQKTHFPHMTFLGKLENYDDANTDYTKLKEALITYPNLTGILGGPMPTSAGAGKLVVERKLRNKLFVSSTGLPSVAGEYVANDDVAYIQFWDPAIAGYALNTLAIMALEKRTEELKNGLSLGLTGYTDLKVDTQNANLFYGDGWIGVTKENLSDYNF